MNGFYVFLSSADSKDKFSNNSYDDFTVEFSQEIELDCNCYHAEWAFALTEITIINSSQSLLPESCIILCDLAQSSYIRDSHVPVLRTIAAETEATGSLYQSYYISVNKHKFNKIRIYIKNKDLSPLNKTLWQSNTIIKLTLHFQKT